MAAIPQRVRQERRPPGTARVPVFRRLVWLAFVAGWTTALLTPHPVSLAHEVLPEAAQFPSFKLAHVTCYAIMTVLTGWLRAGGRARGVLLAFLCAHAFLTEFFQQFVPGRSMSLTDTGFDLAGILIGLAVTRKWWLMESLAPLLTAGHDTNEHRP